MNKQDMLLIKDKMDISDIVIQYATGADSRNWALYRDCFTEEVEIDFTSFSGGSSEKLTSAQWTDRVWGLLPGFDATHHASTNHVHSIDGDTATCISYMVAEHFYAVEKGDSSVTLGGKYTNKLVRTQGGWKIFRCQLDITWRRGNEELWALAATRAAEIFEQRLG